MAVETVTAHSPRVMLVSALAHHSADAPALQLQGRWKDPAMPLKYTRERGFIPLGAISALAADFRRGWRPAAPASSSSAALPAVAEGADDRDDHDADAETESSVSDLDNPMDIEFWEPAPGARFSRVHILSVINHTLMACGNVSIDKCVPVHEAPQLDSVCLNCLRPRPEAKHLTAPPE